ncbi:MAG: hypothetical protein IJG80_08360 [Selenomonadaceae bacterium]|nr:hypothetical protein [Selenomonadaceae bacterium]MBQ3725439.1 hypothetical protein [Selenomonadaceae bacterium]MBQ9496176.1 hypothetical protein [Selenomonadaceae bacterium]
MALNVSNLIPLAEPVTDVAKNISNNVTKVKVTKLNNRLVKFTSAVAAMQSVVTCVTSAIEAGIDAYARIQLSHDQVRITQAQADAYIQDKREQTEQIRIAQKEETLRCLAALNADLESKKLEFKKFETELAESRASREFKQEQWRRKVDALEKYFNPLFDYAKKIRDDYYASNLTNEKARAELERVDESIRIYVLSLNELYK